MGQRRDPPAGRPLPARQRHLDRDAPRSRTTRRAGARSTSSPSRPRRTSARSSRRSQDADARHRGPQDRRPLRELHGHRAHRRARRIARSPPQLAARRRDRRGRAFLRTLGELERDGVGGARRPVRRARPGRSRRATSSSSSRAASACPTRATTALEKFADDPRPRTARTSSGCSRSPGSPDAADAGRPRLRARDRAGHGSTGTTCAAATRSQTYNLRTLERGRGARRRRSARRGSTASPPAAARRSPRSSSASRASSTGLGGLLDRGRGSTTGRRGCAGTIVHGARRVPAPTTFVDENFDFYGRTLTGAPVNRERWKRGVGARRGRAGRGRRPRLRRAALPARGQGARWTCWSPTSSRPTAGHRRRSSG